MVETLCSVPALEPISPEELVELGNTLDKFKQNPEQSLKLLKVLERKQITYQLLIDTKIGKRLSAVEEKPDAGTDVVEAIKGLKEKLKKRWTEVYRRTKSKGDDAKSKDKLGPEESSADIKLPYFGEKGRKAYETGNQSRDFRLEKLVQKL